MKCDPTLTLGRITPRKSALRPKSQGLPAGECRHNGYLLSGAYSRSRLSRRTVSSRVAIVRFRNGSDLQCLLNDSSLRVAHARSDFQTRLRGQSIDMR